MKPTTIDFYNEIRRDFNKYSSIREFGVLKYKKDWVFAKLGNKHRRSPKTIENIVTGRV